MLIYNLYFTLLFFVSPFTPSFRLPHDLVIVLSCVHLFKLLITTGCDRDNKLERLALVAVLCCCSALRQPGNGQVNHALIWIVSLQISMSVKVREVFLE